MDNERPVTMVLSHPGGQFGCVGYDEQDVVDLAVAEGAEVVGTDRQRPVADRCSAMLVHHSASRS